VFSLKMYFRLLSIQIRSQMQFQTSFWFELISTGLLSGSYFLSLALIMQRFENLAGWRLGEIAFLVGLIETSFGTMDMIFSGFDEVYFSQLVHQGTLDQILLRPVHSFWQILGSRFLLRRIGRIVEGLIILGVSASLLDIQWTTAKLLYLPVVFISQVLTMGALFITGATLTFWTVQSVEAMNILTYGGTEMMSYPVQIYPGWMRGFFTYVIPFVFLNYSPALYFLDKPDPLNLPPVAPFLAPLVAVVMFSWRCVSGSLGWTVIKVRGRETYGAD
jgi:ABC-2 type transport system permease protein